MSPRFCDRDAGNSKSQLQPTSEPRGPGPEVAAVVEEPSHEIADGGADKKLLDEEVAAPSQQASPSIARVTGLSRGHRGSVRGVPLPPDADYHFFLSHYQATGSLNGTAPGRTDLFDPSSLQDCFWIISIRDQGWRPGIRILKKSEIGTSPVQDFVNRDGIRVGPLADRGV